MAVTASTLAPAARYSAFAIALHWLLAAALLGLFIVGVYMTDLPFSPQRLKLYNWHKWAGIVVLALSFARLAGRLLRRPPADPPMPAWQATAAHATHRLMYVLFFAVPLSGWAYTSAVGFPVVVFGVWPLPDFVARDAAFAEQMKTWHAWLSWLLAAATLAHTAAALKHHFVDRDGLLHRMLPGGGR